MTKLVIQICWRYMYLGQTYFLQTRWFLIIQQTCRHANLLIYYRGFVALQQKYRLLVQLSVFCCSDLHILLHFSTLQLKWRKKFFLTCLKQYSEELEMAKSTKLQWEWDHSAQRGVAFNRVEYKTVFLYQYGIAYIKIQNSSAMLKI